MKKILFVCALFCLFQSELKAQNTALKTGGSLSTLRGDNNTKKTFLIYFGVLTEKKLRPRLSIQGEFLLAGQGEKDNELFYLQVPLLLKVHTTKQFRLNVGLQAAYLLDKAKGGYRGSIDDGNGWRPIDAYNKFDMGMVAGAEYQTKGLLRFEARYYYGMMNILKSPLDAKFYNQSFHLGIAYSI